jgi:hypothetical protein
MTQVEILNAGRDRADGFKVDLCHLAENGFFLNLRGSSSNCVFAELLQ